MNEAGSWEPCRSVGLSMMTETWLHALVVALKELKRMEVDDHECQEATLMG